MVGRLCKGDAQNGSESLTALRVEIKGDGFPNANNQYGLQTDEKNRPVGLVTWL